MVKLAVIDIGSLKVKLEIGELAGNTVVPIFRDSKLTLLGKGLDKKGEHINEESLKNTINTVNEFMAKTREFEVTKVNLVATEALRRAGNLEEVLDNFQKQIGQVPKIISQNEEAEILFKAVVKDFPMDLDIVLVDMGGGSVQVIWGNQTKIRKVYTLDLGIYSTLQAYVKDRSEDLYPSEKELTLIQTKIVAEVKKLSGLENLKIPLVYGSSVILDLFKFLKFDLKKTTLSATHPYSCVSSELENFLEKIKTKTYKQREELYPFQYGYMWGIQMAFKTILEISQKIGVEEITPSNVNIASGYLLEMSKTL